MDNVWIDKDRCTLCGVCVSVCVRRILVQKDDSIQVTDPGLCILCGHCRAVCPEGAPKFPSLNDEEFVPIPPGEIFLNEEALMALFRSRRSIRLFKNKPVERQKIEKIIEAGRFAPTGGNRQPLHHIVICTKKKIDDIRQMTIKALLAHAERIEQALKMEKNNREIVDPKYKIRQVYISLWRELSALNEKGVDRLFYNAPVIIVSHLDPAGSTFPDVDAGLCAMQMVLMAEALGLGTCFCGFFVFAIEESIEIRKALGIPEAHRAPVSFMLGYPDIKFLSLVARNRARVSWI